MSTYDEFINAVKDIHRLQALQGHLGWDRETIMPEKGASSRADMLSWLAKEAHGRLVSSDLGRMISELEDADDLDEDQRANVREMRRSHDKAIKLPEQFVADYARAKSEAMMAWQEARAASDFSAFEPHLFRLISMTKEKIAYLDVEGTPYDALLDEFEVGMKVSDYDPLFAGLRERLVPLLDRIMAAKSTTPDPPWPEGLHFPIEEQTAFCTKVSEAMGFDFKRVEKLFDQLESNEISLNPGKSTTVPSTSTDNAT